jgi:hypothetical protein
MIEMTAMRGARAMAFGEDMAQSCRLSVLQCGNPRRRAGGEAKRLWRLHKTETHLGGGR